MVTIGDRVRLVAIPDDLPCDDETGGLRTKTVFGRCVGRVFPVVGVNDLGYAELEVGEVNGLAPHMETIWVEPKYLAVVQ